MDSSPVLQVEDLTYIYPRGIAPAIRHLSFQVGRGEIFGFLGPSGAGKTTTQKVMIGLLTDYAGRLSILEKPLSRWGTELYERIGVSFEFPTHFSKLTARENLLYFGQLYERRLLDIDELLARLDLATDGDRRVSQFSKGMLNRLSLARALRHNPEILFLDEPTAGLDPLNARRVKDLIREQAAEGKSVFLTTHDMSVAEELCHHLAIIDEGEVVGSGTPRELKLEHGRATVRVETSSEGEPEILEFDLKGLGDNEDFLELLAGRRIQTIHSQEATLEDVFLEITGRQLHAGVESRK